MLNLIFGMITLLLSTVTFTGEDDGEMLYSIEYENIRHDYVTERELHEYLYIGKIRNDVVNLKQQKPKKNEEKSIILFDDALIEYASARQGL